LIWTFWFLVFSFTIHSGGLFKPVSGVWDAEGGGGKTGAESAALHGHEFNTAYNLYSYLKQHHSTFTNSYHEALNQVDKREFHYFPRGTFLAYHPRRLSQLF
jgi:hypothetical protein